MDWADDISYAIHDLDDYFRAGLVPLHLLRRDKERILESAKRRLKGKPGEFDSQELERAYRRIRNAPFRSPFTGQRLESEDLHRFFSDKIGNI